LVRNGVDAALAVEHGEVQVHWHATPQFVQLVVADNGPGIADADNLFVPFFTTKPDGSGIGLALCRQIAEAHGGTLTLNNRADAGCESRLRLPRW
ncbi:MAG: ATP-binding protein, partial [Myxococcota bacterium]